jgi:tetratricopeptide (TPR) repeat protein
MGKEQYEEAIPDFREALELDPRFAEAEKNLAYALRKQVETEKGTAPSQGERSPR